MMLGSTDCTPGYYNNEGQEAARRDASSSSAIRTARWRTSPTSTSGATRASSTDSNSADVRILLVSDLHYTLKQLDWVLAVASDYDLVVVAGDHLDIASAVEPDAQIAVVLEYLARLAAKTNDRRVLRQPRPQCPQRTRRTRREVARPARTAGVFVDGTSFSTDDVFVTVCPWWDGPRTRDEVDRQLADDARRVGDRRWIWVYHAPPDASPTSWTGERHYGDEFLGAWIRRYRPMAVLCGHVHQSPFASTGSWFDRIGSTVVFNAGRQRGPVPTHIELDTDTGLATWWSLAGTEEQAFASA